MSRLRRGSWLIAYAQLGFALLAVALVGGREIFVTLASYGAADSPDTILLGHRLVLFACALLGAAGAAACALTRDRNGFTTVACGLVAGAAANLLEHGALAVLCYAVAGIVFAGIVFAHTTARAPRVLAGWLGVVAIGFAVYALARGVEHPMTPGQDWLRVVGMMLALVFWISWLMLALAWLGAFPDARAPVATLDPQIRTATGAIAAVLCVAGVALAAIAAWAAEHVSSDGDTWGTLVLGLVVFVAGLVALSHVRGKPLSAVAILPLAISLIVAGCLFLHQRVKSAAEVGLETHEFPGFSIGLPAGTLARIPIGARLMARHAELGMILVEWAPTDPLRRTPLEAMESRCGDQTIRIEIEYLGPRYDQSYVVLRKRIRATVSCL